MIIYLNLRENHVQNYLIQITYRINCLGKAYKIDLLHRFWSLHYDITRTHSFSRLFPFWTEWLFIFLILHARSIASILKHQRAHHMIGGLLFLSTGREKVLSLGSTKKGSIQRNMIVCNSWLGIGNKQSNYHGRRITKFVRCVFQVFLFSPLKNLRYSFNFDLCLRFCFRVIWMSSWCRFNMFCFSFSTIQQ